MTISTVTVQTTPESQPSTPHWMGEVAAFAHILSQTGILTAITDQVRFARARMGTDDLIDCVVVLIGYALSGEPPFQAFDARLVPCANEFMALFGRNQLPTRSACKIRLGIQQGTGLKYGINEVSSTGEKLLWRQERCYDIWNGQPFTP